MRVFKLVTEYSKKKNISSETPHILNTVLPGCYHGLVVGKECLSVAVVLTKYISVLVNFGFSHHNMLLLV